MELNSTTIKGRANVAMLTLGGLAVGGIMYKMKGGKKVSAVCRVWTEKIR